MLAPRAGGRQAAAVPRRGNLLADSPLKRVSANGHRGGVRRSEQVPWSPEMHISSV
jgi:hypothetical protein